MVIIKIIKTTTEKKGGGGGGAGGRQGVESRTNYRTTQNVRIMINVFLVLGCQHPCCQYLGLLTATQL